MTYRRQMADYRLQMVVDGRHALGQLLTSSS